MRAYLSLGSNVGDRLANLQAAVNFLDLRAGRVSKISRVYETAPLYVLDQAAFYNAVIEIETDLEPLALLTRIKEIEDEVGRIPRQRWGPREIDVDILCVIDDQNSQVRVNLKELTLPHPHMAERRFVIDPLKEMAEFLLPKTGLDKKKLMLQHVKVVEEAKLSIHRD